MGYNINPLELGTRQTSQPHLFCEPVMIVPRQVYVDQGLEFTPGTRSTVYLSSSALTQTLQWATSHRIPYSGVKWLKYHFMTSYMELVELGKFM
jgi:hypothetical protein